MTTAQISLPANALRPAETTPFTALTFTTRATLPALDQFIPIGPKLYAEAERLGLTVSGPLQWAYTGVSGNPEDEFTLQVVLPVAQAAGQPEGFAFEEFATFRCLTYTYTGSWDTFNEVYDALFAQFYAAGYQYNGHVREVYHQANPAEPDRSVTEFQLGYA